ncbi:sulfur reduction protein DsrJ [Candidatus Thioglobus sp.]|jgi:cytochrome c553|uniref:sulfur reduction protein DsrJ n=1 Tax=Candidatus Thioglobus sp. TaxID=2026721 RepID=UPI0017789C7A|nr:sulfur reduction protein DsrJ [Candidatus Thioglobus sp.]
MYRLLVVFLSLILSAPMVQAGNGLSGNSEAAQSSDQYHDSVSVIRKMHPEFLNHKRDKTLRQGVRTKENSLKGCVNCHANKDEQTNKYHPVDKQDQFCSTCHQKVSVSVDCFSCHRTTPGKGNK